MNINKDGFQDLIDSSIILRFNSIWLFVFPNEISVNLLIKIFKLSTCRHKSVYQGVPFTQKGFNRVAKVEISPDAGAHLGQF